MAKKFKAAKPLKYLKKAISCYLLQQISVNNTMNLLKGKKTYLTAGAAIIFALVLFLLGQLGGVLTVMFILGVAIAVFLRQGINDLAAKISEGQENKKE